MPDQSSAATEHAILREITAPLERLPDDPLALVDADFPTAMRGYDRHAVEEYVERTRRLVAELQATRSPEAAVRRALERVGDQVSGILQRAHETAEQITARSRSEAEDRLEEARREAGQMIDAAKERVRELDADTDRIWGERQRIVADAEDLAGQLQAVARDATDRFVEPDPGHAEEEAAWTGDGGGGEIRLDDEMTWPPAGEGTSVVEVGDELEDVPSEDAALDDDGLEDDELEDLADEELADDDLADEDLADEELADDDLAEDAPAETDQEPLDIDPGIDRTVAFTPLRLHELEDDGSEPDSDGPAPRRVTDEDSTRIIPPASDAATRRRQSE
jgi:cell division septum initiation protein DivIVA